jgi:hypothetical protein
MFRRLFAGAFTLFAVVVLLYALLVRPYYAFWARPTRRSAVRCRVID